MNKEDYLKILDEKIEDEKAKEIFKNQIETYYKYKDYKLPKHNYNIGDKVYLHKGTLMHGTYKNIEGLKEIVKDGLISSYFINGRLSKYPSSVGVWNLKQDYYLKDYINFYSGGTILYYLNKDELRKKGGTAVIPYNKMNNLLDIIQSKKYEKWILEQTKEARFLPSLIQNSVQIGIIFNGQSKEIKELLNGDILNPNFINDEDVKEFVNPDYYERFIVDRKNKDDFFTDRESAIIFGIPANFIEGILVGRIYEKDNNVLEEIKQLLPNVYICNLDGEIIMK